MSIFFLALVSYAHGFVLQTNTSVRLDTTQPFHDYTIQCSHNTYIWGRQSGYGTGAVSTTDKGTMEVALDLGYRCIELDVHDYGPSKNMVAHVFVPAKKLKFSPVKYLTNAVALSGFVEEIGKWLMKDESVEPSKLRTPIVISIENHVHKSSQNKMAAIFKNVLGDRIIAPNVFTQDSPLGKFMFAKRGIILKTGKAKGDLEGIIAMPKKPYQGSYSSKSIEVDCKAVTAKEQAEIQKELSKGKLIRVYPCMWARASNNYNPAVAFEVGAQMVCINFQGSCPGLWKTCKKPAYAQETCGGVPGCQCDCNRDVAWRVEQLFAKYGQDGYAPVSLVKASPEFTDVAMWKAGVPIEDMPDGNLHVSGDEAV